jgi:ABC-2 type transport system permease protein
MMTVSEESAEPGRLLVFHARPASARQPSERSPRGLIVHTRLQTTRILRHWARDATTTIEALILPIALLFTLNLLLGKGISHVTGNSALYASVPMVAMVGAMSGSTVSGIGLMRERTDGLLSRLWVLPVHRASGVLSRTAADAVRIFFTTVVVLCTGLLLGFRFRHGIAESVAWLFVPTILGLAFCTLVDTIALYTAKTLVVEATALLYALLMFFSTGFVPLAQYPAWVQPAVEHQPLSYAVEAMRGLALGGPVLSPMVGLLLWAGGIVAVCAIPLAHGYRRASMRG